MNRYDARLNALEEAIRPATRPTVVIAIMDYDQRGNCESLTMQGVRFEPLPNESEDELCDRANQALGPFDSVILVRMVAAVDGRPAPGFERFASRKRGAQ